MRRLRVVTPVGRLRVAKRAALVLALVAALPAAARAVPFEDYHERVDAALSELSDLYAVSEEEPASPEEKIARVRALLPERETVETAGGPVEVDHSWLLDELDEFEASSDPEIRSNILDEVTTRLNSLDLHLQTLAEAGSRDSAGERERLEEILSRPEFRAPSESAVARFMRELRERIGETLRAIAEALFGGVRGATVDAGVRVVILAAGAVALLLLVRAVAQALARGRRPEKRRKTRTVFGEEIDESTTAADLAAAARECAARGEYREAVRKLFVALLYRLDERGLVRLRSEATNREYVALVRDVARLHPVMASMADTFDRVWYGREPVDAERYADFERQHAEAVAAVDASVARSA